MTAGFQTFQGLEVSELTKYLVKVERVYGGHQALFRFPNNYGASVVRHKYSYGKERGLFEVAVIGWQLDNEWSIKYDTHITNDVLGSQTNADVVDVLNQISAL